jgi:hypothetical protein
MFSRIAQPALATALTWSPAVAILGPRQIGKTTLARALLETHPNALYLDLESPQDRAALGDGPLFLQAHADQLIILDEVQHTPELFSVLRGEIDRARRPGRFVLLGSASFELLRQSQSLAGRLSLIDMFPLLVDEVGSDLSTLQSLWLRGGFPPSFTALNEQASWRWREAFIRHLLHTDLPADIPARQGDKDRSVPSPVRFANKEHSFSVPCADNKAPFDHVRDDRHTVCVFDHRPRNFREWLRHRLGKQLARLGDDFIGAALPVAKAGQLDRKQAD